MYFRILAVSLFRMVKWHFLFFLTYLLVYFLSESSSKPSKIRRNIGYGRNTMGVLGVGDSDPRTSPVDVGSGNVFSNLGKRYERVWACGQRTFLKVDRELYGFGSDYSCGIGFGDVPFLSTFPTPLKLPILSRNFTQTEILEISGIQDHTLALGSNGGVWSFGSNYQGALGIGNVDLEKFVCFPNRIVDHSAMGISAGGCHSLVVFSDYSVSGAGCNGQGELGIKYRNVTYDRLTHIPIPNNARITSVSTGPNYSLFLSNDGDVYFTGIIVCETVGPSFRKNEITKVIDHNEVGNSVMSIYAGNSHFVGQLSNGSVFGFGCNDYNCLGPTRHHTDNGTGFYDHLLLLNTSMIDNVTDGGIIKTVAGDSDTAVLTSMGHVFFMGGATLLPRPQKLETFTRLNVGEEKIVDLDISWDHLISMSERSELFCTGENYFFQCGITPNSAFVEYQLANSKVFSENDVFQISMCTEHAFGITGKGKVFSYGINSFAQLGTGTFMDYLLPYPLYNVMNGKGEEVFFVSGDVNLETTALLSDTGELYVVGNGRSGSLGLGDMNTRFVPTLVGKEKFGGLKVTAVRNDREHVHALVEDGTFYSWGSGSFGQLGMGNGIHSSLFPLPNTYLLPEKVVLFTAGLRSVAVVTQKQEIFYWGQISSASQFEETVFLPKKMDVFGLQGGNANITLIEAGNSFIVIGVEFPSNFSIYWWGVLGQNEYPPIIASKTPKLLMSVNLDLSFVTCIAKYHLICIDRGGGVWGMGLNDWGQLSPELAEKKYYHELVKIPVDVMFSKNGLIPISGFSRAAISDYTTVLQEYVACHGLLDSETNVCSSHGVCIKNNTCRCYNGWGGFDCRSYKCSDNTTTVNCNGHGVCEKPGQCICHEGWANFDQKKLGIGIVSSYGFCSYPICPSSVSGKICSGTGECNVDPLSNEPRCFCNEMTHGESCDHPTCFGADGTGSSDGCGYYGKCVKYNQCQCATSGLNTLMPFTQSGDKCVVSGGMIFGYVVAFLGMLCICCLCYVSSCCFCCCWRFMKKAAKESEKSKKIQDDLASKDERETHKEKFHDYKSLQDFEKLTKITSSTSNEEEKYLLEREDGDLEEKNFAASETTILLQDDALSLGKNNLLLLMDDYHFFEGNPFDGEGTIYFSPTASHYIRQEEDKKNKKKRGGKYPVFHGNFTNGKKRGWGVEYRLHFEDDPSIAFYEDEENFRFAGHFKDDQRDGKGTEYDNKGKKSLVGEYVSGMLLRILSIDYPLRVIDLHEDIEYDVIPEQIGVGGFSNIFVGRLKKYRNRECAVKFFKDQETGGEKKRKEPKWMRRTKSVPQEEEEVEGEEREVISLSDTNDELGYISTIYGTGIDDLKKLWETRRLFKSVGDVLKILSMFKHPNIIKIFGWSGPVTEVKYFGYVMERCVESVRQRYFDRNRPKLTMKAKNLIMYQTALAMSHVHNVMGLIHSDFDMADRDEMDFSGMKNRAAAQGSCFHIAPECLRNQGFDSRCDVYSFGIMMYELILERMDDPFDVVKSRSCYVCGEQFHINQVTEGETHKYFARIMMEHYEKCGIRPEISQYEETGEDFGNVSEEDSFNDTNVEKVRMYDWQILLMKQCWAENPELRPSFRDIVEVFLANHDEKGKKDECIREIILRPYQSAYSSLSINSGD